ncbi:hypothetical protein ABFX02_06G145800 [Erythranthe guttata]
MKAHIIIERVQFEQRSQYGLKSPRTLIRVQFRTRNYEQSSIQDPELEQGSLHPNPVSLRIVPHIIFFAAVFTWN